MKAKQAFDALNQGVLICDYAGKILYYNDAYENYIGVALESAQGQPITKFRPGAIVPQVLENKTAVEGILRVEKGREYYASVYPILEASRAVGTISIVTSFEFEEEKGISSTKNLAQRVSEFEAREIRTAIAANGGGTEGKKKAAKELGISLATLYNKLNKKF